MDPAKGALVKTFGNIADADIAAGQLRSAGIECLITSDDCGGMYPSMGVIQLRVDPEIAEDAREVLNEAAATSNAATTPPEEKAPVPGQRPMPRVFRFNSGLIVGAIIGALLHFSYENYQKYHDRNDRYDYDKDGVPDAEEIWKGGELREVRRDRNGDGRPDDWIHYREGQEEADDNFDGKADISFTFSPGQLYVSGLYDTDFNGVPDMTATYSNSVLKQMDWRPNGTNVVLRRQFFRHGILAEEWCDLNGDGWFDVSIKFDAFNTPIRTNNLRPATRSP